MGMIKVIKRRWRYLTARTEHRWEQSADPKIQLEQAITDAQAQHRKLKDHAADVIGNHKHSEMRLSRALADLERLNSNARNALRMGYEASQSGDTKKAESFMVAAEDLAGQMVVAEQEVNGLKNLCLQTAQSAEEAKQAIAQNQLNLQETLREKQKLVGQIDQARMQEQMNTAVASLSEGINSELPSFNEIRDKIEARYAKAKGVEELAEERPQVTMLQIEQASNRQQAKQIVAGMREQLGLPPPAVDNEAEITEGTIAE